MRCISRPLHLRRRVRHHSRSEEEGVANQNGAKLDATRAEARACSVCGVYVYGESGGMVPQHDVMLY